MTTTNSMQRQGATRRTFLKAAALGAASIAAPSIVHARNKQQLVFANWGGSWFQAMKTAWIEPFTKETGIEVVSAPGNSLGRLEAMEKGNAVEWDVMETLPVNAMIGEQKGLLAKIDFDIVNRDRLMKRPEFFNDYSIPEVIFGRVLAYNKKLLKEHPSEWGALWDLKRFPGKRALPNHVDTGILEVALVADGVTPDKLYPLDVPRALKKLSQIRNEVIWFDTVTQSAQIMRAQNASMGDLANGRALNLKHSGAPIELAPNANVLTWSVFVVPKNAPHKEAAMKFLAYVLKVKAQVAIARAYYYGPVVTQAWSQIPQARRRILPGDPEGGEHGLFLNYRWWAKNLSKTNDKFEQWMIG